MSGWGKRGSTTAHRQWRAVVLDRDRWTCLVIVDQGGDVVPPEVLAAASGPEPGWRHCGEFADTAGHILALAEGGARFDPANGRAECRRHNYSHGARLGNTLRRAARLGDRGWSW